MTQGLTADELGKLLYDQAQSEIDRLITGGMTREQAAAKVADALNDLAWNLGTSRSPLSG